MSEFGNLIDDHGLWSDDQRAQVAAIRSQIETEGLEAVRVSWPDQHGLLRGKSLTIPAFEAALQSGSEISMAPFSLDPANSIVFNPFMAGGGFGVDELSGVPNVTMVPDPSTFRVLPWAPGTGWILADLHHRDGRPFPLSPRGILKASLRRLAEQGYGYVAGLEVEWYLTRIVDPSLDPAGLGGPGMPPNPPEVMPVATGYSYLLENHLDEVDHVLSVLRSHLLSLGLPLRTLEDEWAPSQIETTFDVLRGLEPADAMVLFRTATKQICRRMGHLASFMCKPAIPSFYPSGWHLHQSLTSLDTGENVFAPSGEGALSDVGRHYVAGILAHAAAASSFTTPTVNGYRRNRPYSLAPDRAAWAFDNRAAMVRVISSPGDPASHIENRVGEPAANPYLYMASQIEAGLAGIEQALDPGPMEIEPYAAEVEQLPTNLGAALDALENDGVYRSAFGDQFLDYWLTLKRFEFNRFVEASGADAVDSDDVTEWEHREYFALL